MSDSKVNLFLVGAAKSGTTSLAAMLDRHDDVGLGISKEPFFFIDGYGLSDSSAYFSSFPSNVRYKLDASTGYLYDEAAASRIHSYNPDAKIIIILRNPLSFVVSYWEYLKANGRETLSFPEAVTEETRTYRKSNEFVRRCEQWPASYLYLDRALYSAQVERYLNLFGRDNVFIATFEDMITSDSTLKRLFEFLDLSLPSNLTLNQNNRTGEPAPLVRWLRFSPALEPAKKLYRSITPIKARYVLRQFLVKRSMKGGEYKKYKMDQELRAKLVNFFKSDVERMKVLLPDIDFSCWSDFRD
jgi:hypothetical protein